MALFLNDLGVVSAIGNTKAEHYRRLLLGDRSGLAESQQFRLAKPVIVGEVKADLPRIDERFAVYDCRNNQLLLAALAQIQTTVDNMLSQFGANRIGVVIGTSTSGVRNTELALATQAKTGALPNNFHFKQQQLGAGADFLADYLGLKAPAYTVSTACSSSARAIASARRLLTLDICDAVIVGGADSLCHFTLHGFAALESIAEGWCKPFGQHRDGINISEAAALFVLSKVEGPVRLSGIGASSDAYHFSAPSPDGQTVIKAMQQALQDAQKTPSDIDYINLHGTATRLNDAMESRSVAKVFAESVAVSSTKGMTGHALGASAALEMGICWLLLTDNDTNGLLPPNINDDVIDPEFPPLNFVQLGQGLGRPVSTCLSNSFAFGGNNISIVLERS